MLGVGGQLRQRNLMSPPAALDFPAVHDLRARPAFRALQDDHRPARARAICAGARIVLDLRDPIENAVEGGGHLLMHRSRLFPADEVRLPPITVQQLLELAARNARQQRRICDLETVQMQDGQHRAIVHRIEELV